MNATLSYEEFREGWNSKKIGIALPDGDTHVLLLAAMHKSCDSPIGWKFAKWMHRGLFIGAIVMAFKVSFWWLLLILLAVRFRKAWYEKARREIAKRCADDPEVFCFITSLRSHLSFVRA